MSVIADRNYNLDEEVLYIMTQIEDRVKEIIKGIYNKKHDDAIDIITTTSLRNDLGFDSFDFAELTVKIEDAFGVDIFEKRMVDTFEQIISEIK